MAQSGFPGRRVSTTLDPAFMYGVATAAYQIEGSTEADGRLPSIWDAFSARPGKVLNGDSGAVACDHYRLWAQDVGLIAALGVDAYRLSLAWPRLITRAGKANPAGFDFYKRLLDALGARGIRRFVTLYHWDLPQWMEERGGWLNRETAWRFADYADLAVRELGDRVDSWATLNEPFCSAWLGYGSGEHAPGLTDPRLAGVAGHHLLLGHGLAMQALGAGGAGGRSGIVINLEAVQPASQSPADLRAAHLFDLRANKWFLDPLLRGEYPEELFTVFGARPAILPGDMAIIQQKLSFLGINYYTRSTVRAPLTSGEVSGRDQSDWGPSSGGPSSGGTPAEQVPDRVRPGQRPPAQAEAVTGAADQGGIRQAAAGAVGAGPAGVAGRAGEQRPPASAQGAGGKSSPPDVQERAAKAQSSERQMMPGQTVPGQRGAGGAEASGAEASGAGHAQRPAAALAPGFAAGTSAAALGAFETVTLPDLPRSDMGWEIYPEGLHQLLVGLAQRYPDLPPVYITENGMADADEMVGGAVSDPAREAYLRDHLAAVDAAIRDGVDVRGYFAWSLLDNFEWGWGYGKRFGLCHVDYDTQIRTPKRSALWLKQRIASRNQPAG